MYIVVFSFLFEGTQLHSSWLIWLKIQRNADWLLWARNLTEFISCMRELDGGGTKQVSSSMSEVINQDFPASLIDEGVKDPRAREALNFGY